MPITAQSFKTADETSPENKRLAQQIKLLTCKGRLIRRQEEGGDGPRQFRDFIGRAEELLIEKITDYGSVFEMRKVEFRGNVSIYSEGERRKPCLKKTLSTTERDSNPDLIGGSPVNCVGYACYTGLSPRTAADVGLGRALGPKLGQRRQILPRGREYRKQTSWLTLLGVGEFEGDRNHSQGWPYHWLDQGWGTFCHWKAACGYTDSSRLCIEKKNLSTLDLYSNLYLVIGSLVYCESSASDQAASEAVH
uniref:Uncharacterized protein n=1 Tax=Timema cristinae TaxID=61476 RepID=A0A7R9CXY7_TIMCR|nr:unnamed protein product [Timema cristinae]